MHCACTVAQQQRKQGANTVSAKGQRLYSVVKQQVSHQVERAQHHLHCTCGALQQQKERLCAVADRTPPAPAPARRWSTAPHRWPPPSQHKDRAQLRAVSARPWGCIHLPPLRAEDALLHVDAPPPHSSALRSSSPAAGTYSAQVPPRPLRQHSYGVGPPARALPPP